MAVAFLPPPVKNVSGINGQEFRNGFLQTSFHDYSLIDKHSNSCYCEIKYTTWAGASTNQAAATGLRETRTLKKSAASEINGCRREPPLRRLFKHYYSM
jgi:hypothetical protein